MNDQRNATTSALKLLRKVDLMDHTLSCAQLRVFLEIASVHPGKMHSSNLNERKNVTTALTRVCDTLGAGSKQVKKAGLNWIKTEVDDEDRRMRIYSLTDKGLEILGNIADTF